MRIKRERNRNGTAIAELAVCLPVIFLIVFASIEACNMIALRQIISESAYAGALTALKRDAEEPDVIACINASLAARNVAPSNVIVSGAGGAAYDSLVHGDTVIVTVEAESNANAVGPQLFGFGQTLSTSATVIKQ